jgi:hypothetical protein
MTGVTGLTILPNTAREGNRGKGDAGPMKNPERW